MSLHPRVIGALAAALLAAGCAGPAATGVAETLPREIALRNPGFESDFIRTDNCAPQWGCSAHADPFAFHFVVDETAPPSGGKRSLRIERVRNEPWGLITQVVQDPKLVGAKLRFSIAVRTQGLTGEGAGAYFFAHGRSGRRMAHAQQLVKGTNGWERVTLEFRVPADTELFEVGVSLYGPGQVWVDDARLELLELAAPDKKPV